MEIFSRNEPVVIDRLGVDSVIKALNHKTNKSLKDIPDAIEIETSELKEFFGRRKVE